MMQEDDLQIYNDNPDLLTLLPGGAAPSPVERNVAFLVLGALAFLILLRRGFPRAR